MEIQTDCRVTHWKINIFILQQWIVFIIKIWYRVWVVTVYIYRTICVITCIIRYVNPATWCAEIIVGWWNIACHDWNVPCNIHAGCVTRNVSTNLYSSKRIRIDVNCSKWTTGVTRMCRCSICRCIFPIHISTVVLRVIANIYSIIIRIIWWNGGRRNNQTFCRSYILKLYW